MRSPRTLAALALIALTVPIAAGCSSGSSESGSDGGAVSNANGPSGGGPSEADRSAGVKFATCMRDNGVGAFPDPDASGELTIDGIVNGSSLDTDGPAWKQAIAACRELQPAGFTGRERSAEQQRAALAFARCMRDHGIADFPDPEPDGPLIDTNRIPSAKGRGALSIPGFTAAQDACGGRAEAAGVQAP